MTKPPSNRAPLAAAPQPLLFFLPSNPRHTESACWDHDPTTYCTAWRFVTMRAIFGWSWWYVCWMFQWFDSTCGVCGEAQ
ncbi:hypothetical protein T440DRAFT_466966 [Plenodomus tracheiphilus IPT5]|uniref:Uncharacterized protein n=1 Tax=Plenodomus tracheiphilus IPT5 TaxID=1408161 RepID=A0A6A7BDM6_9PLEO|nr:hypothetical protein T440DRAFT_466966 [Plenodomus tracheiphilus IPT5]